MKRFEIANGRRDGTRERIGVKNKRLEVGEGRKRRGYRTGEIVVGHIKEEEVREIGDSRIEFAGVAGGVEGDSGDAKRDGRCFTLKGAGKMGDPGRRAGVGGEIPREETGVVWNGGGSDGSLESLKSNDVGVES